MRRFASAISPAGLELSQPTISHHMARLKEIGLVEAEKQGIWIVLPTARRPRAGHQAASRPADRLGMPARASSEGSIQKEVPEVLFVCVHNAGRSQMAAGLLDKRGAGRIRVRSAGSTPAAELNPRVVEAMQEIGIDISHEFPKPLTDEFVKAADVVITMGCGDACPIYPGKRYEDWDLVDPAGKDLETVRQIRDDIDVRVQALVNQLVDKRSR